MLDDKLDEKASFWKKKGFYIAASVAIICLLCVGTIYYGKNSINKLKKQDVAQTTQTPATDKNNKAVADNKKADAQKIKETNANKSVSLKKQIAEKKKATQITEKKKTPVSVPKKHKAISAMKNTINNANAFNAEAGLAWPVKGDILLKYSMNNTIYFKTLAQYKCNPGVAIKSKKGTHVKAAADCIVTKLYKDAEHGNMVETNIGSKYTVLYGQLNNVSVNRGDKLKEGDVIGTVNAPTKYFTAEGTNLYFQVLKEGKTVDPLLLLR